ncbi:MAG: hypothetical protein HC904_00985 [Blastochloris sp.]|nr:hypothetical protein [Blastochloris sp.]
MVSVSLLALIMTLVFQVISATSDVWQKTSKKVSSFQESRAAFESLTRKASQAVLNPYWDYDPPLSTPGSVPSRYLRQSELHFISGQGNVPGGVLEGVSREGSR